FSDKDRQPWRFRRRLSLLRRPIIELDTSDDPATVVAPGLLREAFAYSADSYHEGAFPGSQLRSDAMQRWCGRAAGRRGKAFSRDVAARLEKLGWCVESEVPVTKILRKGFGKINYGDVDVLAWNKKAGRVLAIECKDLHFHKTPGEVAEQLSDFRGTSHDGKRDFLKKHLDRCEVLGSHCDRVAAYIKFDYTPTIETWIVFRNPVPMLFAWERFKDRVHITTFGKLAEV
ncbi:MAG TPA: hypothetical protein VHZ24_05450, partial [Pirellulales bacterium]|nr:hypothetical protein [Pirellulales bacterium]